MPRAGLRPRGMRQLRPTSRSLPESRSACIIPTYAARTARSRGGEGARRTGGPLGGEEIKRGSGERGSSTLPCRRARRAARAGRDAHGECPRPTAGGLASVFGVWAQRVPWLSIEGPGPRRYMAFCREHPQENQRAA